MAKKTKLIIIISILVVSIVLTTSGVILHILEPAPKTALTTNEFKKIAKNNNLNVKNLELTDSSGNPNGNIKEAVNAKSEKGWQLDYYIIKNEKLAKNIFKDTKQIYLTFKNDLSEEQKKSKVNYDVFTMKTQTSFMHVCRVDNTVLAISADDDDEKRIIKIIKQLGYN